MCIWHVVFRDQDKAPRPQNIVRKLKHSFPEGPATVDFTAAEIDGIFCGIEKFNPFFTAIRPIGVVAHFVNLHIGIQGKARQAKRQDKK